MPRYSADFELTIIIVQIFHSDSNQSYSVYWGTYPFTPPAYGLTGASHDTFKGGDLVGKTGPFVSKGEAGLSSIGPYKRGN